MSVHEMTTAQGRQVTVGWDAPLSTYWCQLDIEEETPTVWAGGTPFEVSTPEALAEAMSEYAEIPTELREQLAADKREEGSRFGAGLFDMGLYKTNRNEVTPEQAEAMAEALRRHGHL